MKYMGSKRVMLNNGLGSLILDESKNAKRIVDLFCGACSVVNFAAENTELPILAIDLQEYSVILAKSIIGRKYPINPEELEMKWINTAERELIQSEVWNELQEISAKIDMRAVKSYVERCRELCKQPVSIGPIWKAYGGHYFSPKQAMTFDYLLKYLPEKPIKKTVCQAALIVSAMRCVASPGHTAQPLQPTKTGKYSIIDVWQRDLLAVCRKVLKEISVKHAKTLGKAYVSEAVAEARKLRSTDLVVVDPPYSGVQYSRFYHVLETLAQGSCGEVSGVGRYPLIEERPQSAFSNAGQSKDALIKLLSNLAGSGVTIIFTFPEGECSNGLSGDIVMEESKKLFSIKKELVVQGKFSTLGGNKRRREPCKKSSELILLMRPK